MSRKTAAYSGTVPYGEGTEISAMNICGELQHNIVKTADGSWTLRHPCGETYHSRHGARTECEQVFLHNSGIARRLQQGQACTVLEIGFGSGMNFVATALYAARYQTPLHYIAVEPAPPPPILVSQVLRESFPGQEANIWIDAVLARIVGRSAARVAPITLAPITLDCVSELEHLDSCGAHAIYLDAFSPKHAAKCWSSCACQCYFGHVAPGGTLASYCVQGDFRRNLVSEGWRVQRLPGPPGKREVLLAYR